MHILREFEKRNYLVSLPKINTNSRMEFFKWSAKDPLMVNKYGIPEPISKKIVYPDLLLVPIVAFDKKFNRIGYGGGYYDRYIEKIKKNKKVISIGLAYSFQKVQKILANKYDVKLDYVVTEKKIEMRILFLGDVVGNSGCSKIINNLSDQLRLNNIDFVIVNGENASETGVGLTKEICKNFFNPV